MNRVVQMDIGGTAYPLCFSTAVSCAMDEKFHGYDGFNAVMQSDSIKARLDAALWMLDQLLQSGKRRAEWFGEAAPPPPTLAVLPDLFTVADLLGVVTKINEALAAGNARDVEAEPPKNAETTPGIS